MPSILIGDELYDWTPGFAAGDPMEDYVEFLHNLYITRMTIRARYWLGKNPTATYEETQSAIRDLASAFTFTDESEPDAVEAEALEIAEESIRARLAADGFPEPKSLRDHALQLIGDERILAEAKRRVIARSRAAREILA